ncbi:MAG: hypothetical protein IJ867_04310 [Clostridia bacterium]|nr:hypothetical protein [Clostridia bacterium]
MDSYSNAERMVVEVKEIMDNLDEELYRKIPQKIKNVFEKESQSEYKFQYDTTKSLLEQDVCSDTKNFIFLLYRDYWCSSSQEKEQLNQRLIEAKTEKAKKYETNNLFQEQRTDFIKTEPQEEETQVELIAPKESIMAKIISKIKNFFHIK